MDKPKGHWKCLACGEIWGGSQLYLDPMQTINTWTCGNLFCGGRCILIDHPINTIEPEISNNTDEQIERKL